MVFFFYEGWSGDEEAATPKTIVKPKIKRNTEMPNSDKNLTN